MTPDKPGGTPPKYSDAERRRATFSGYKLAANSPKSPPKPPLGSTIKGMTLEEEADYSAPKKK